MRRPGPGVAPLIALTLVMAACSAPRLGSAPTPGTPDPTTSSPDPAVTAPDQTSPSPSGTPGASPRAGERTCGAEPPGDHPPTTSPSPLPDDVQRIADQVVEMRERDFQRPVFPEAVSESEMASRIRDAVDQSLPPDLVAARQVAWATLGAIPATTDLRDAYLDYYSSQVLGFYDTESDELVFIGSDTLSPFERDVLAHELTHALDDQWFHLERVDQLLYACQDEEANGFIALLEGNATYHQLLWAQSYLTPEEYAQFLIEAGQAGAAPPASVPTFVQQMEAFPYQEGLSFASALAGSGGEDAIDAALEDPPVSTEQILHPNLYPSDQPQAVTVPDRSAELGAGWTAGDVLDVGEEFLRLMLNQRIGEAEARIAAAGWDGGQYAAWVQGDRVAVELDTVWDTPAQAKEFAQALEDYGSGSAVSVTRDGDRVVALFGSDREALEALQAAAA